MEIIFTKIDVFQTWLLRYEFPKKVNIAWSVLICLLIDDDEPWLIITEIEILNWLNIVIEKGFENELTNVLNCVFIRTE